MKNIRLVSILSVLGFLAFINSGCKKNKTGINGNGSQDMKAHLKKFGSYHNQVLYRAAEWQDSVNRLQRESRNAGSLLSAGSFGETTPFDPRSVAHHLTITMLFHPNQTLFDPETEMELPEQVHQLTEQAIASRDIANPNSVVRLLLGSEDFYSLSPKERSYFMRLTEIFKTNDYGAMSEIINSEINNFNNDSWGEEEGLFVQGFMSICQGSLEFWSALGTLYPYDAVIEQEQPWIQIDAAGYLYGWVKAWAVDEEKRKRVRIKKGLLVAAEWSTLRYFLKSSMVPSHPFRPVGRIDKNVIF